jgi:hypothetical protein
MRVAVPPGHSGAALRASWWRAQGIAEDKVILLYVGRVSWEKNLRLLLQGVSSHG